MGMQTTVIIRNDGLGEIKRNAQEFVDNLYDAIQHVGVGRYRNGVDISAGCHSNPARVVEVHDADSTTVIAAGGSTAQVLTTVYKWYWRTKEIMRADLSNALRVANANKEK